MHRWARVLILIVTATYAAVALAPCPGGTTRTSLSAAAGPASAPQLRSACPCGCRAALPALSVAGVHASPPSRIASLDLPKLRALPRPVPLRSTGVSRALPDPVPRTLLG